MRLPRWSSKVKTLILQIGEHGFGPGQEVKILHTVQCGQKQSYNVMGSKYNLDKQALKIHISCMHVYMYTHILTVACTFHMLKQNYATFSP